MPPQVPAFKSQPQSTEDQPRQAPMSRRSLLRGAAIGSAAGVIVAGGAGAVAELVRPSQAGIAKPAAKPVVMAPMAPAAMAGPLIVYLRDTTSGELDVFAGTGQMRLKNRALVSALLRALK